MRIFLFFVISISGFLYSATPVQASCACPTSYVANPTQSQCYRNQTMAPTSIAPAQQAIIGDVNQTYYYQYPPVLLTAVSPFPLNAHLSNSSGNNISVINGAGTSMALNVMPTGASFTYWKNRITGPNRISIQSAADWGNSPGAWYTKTVCVNLPLTQKYTMHVGADNRWAVAIDGAPFAKCTDVGNSNSGECFRRGAFIRHVLHAGPHTIEMKYKNDGGEASFWFELLKNDLMQTPTVTQNSQVGVLFSTQSLQNAPNGIDFSQLTETPNPPYCPPGYSYTTCLPGPPTCSRITYIPCL